MKNIIHVGKVSYGWPFYLSATIDIDDLVKSVKSGEWCLIDEERGSITSDVFLAHINEHGVE